MDRYFKIVTRKIQNGSLHQTSPGLAGEKIIETLHKISYWILCHVRMNSVIFLHVIIYLLVHVLTSVMMLMINYSHRDIL